MRNVRARSSGLIVGFLFEGSEILALRVLITMSLFVCACLLQGGVVRGERHL